MWKENDNAGKPLFWHTMWHQPQSFPIPRNVILCFSFSLPLILVLLLYVYSIFSKPTGGPQAAEKGGFRELIIQDFKHYCKAAHRRSFMPEGRENATLHSWRWWSLGMSSIPGKQLWCVLEKALVIPGTASTRPWASLPWDLGAGCSAGMGTGNLCLPFPLPAEGNAQNKSHWAGEHWSSGAVTSACLCWWEKIHFGREWGCSSALSHSPGYVLSVGWNLSYHLQSCSCRPHRAVFLENCLCTGVDVGSNARSWLCNCLCWHNWICSDAHWKQSRADVSWSCISPLTACWHQGWTGSCRDVTHPGGESFSQEGRGCEGCREFPMATQTLLCVRSRHWGKTRTLQLLNL